MKRASVKDKPNSNILLQAFLIRSCLQQYGQSKFILLIKQKYKTPLMASKRSRHQSNLRKYWLELDKIKKTDQDLKDQDQLKKSYRKHLSQRQYDQALYFQNRLNQEIFALKIFRYYQKVKIIDILYANLQKFLKCLRWCRVIEDFFKFWLKQIQ
ncbi:hypothetical protein ABPG74_020575 [Tetrahymena malaccensis]